MLPNVESESVTVRSGFGHIQEVAFVTSSWTIRLFPRVPDAEWFWTCGACVFTVHIDTGMFSSPI